MAKTNKKVKKPLARRKAVVVRRKKPAKKVTPMTVIVRSSLQPVVSKERQAPVQPLSEEQVQKFRDVLTQKRDDLMRIVQRKKEEEIEDIGVGDEADIATHSVEKEML